MARDGKSTGAADNLRSALIIDGTPRVITAVSRSLSRRGIPVLFAHFGAQDLSMGSNAVRLRQQVPAQDPAFMVRLRDIIDKNDVDTVVAGSDKATRLLLSSYDELRQRVALTCPPPAICQIALGKERALLAAERCGIKTPKTFAIVSQADLASKRGSLRFPLIAKPKLAGLPSRFKIAYFNTFVELAQAYKQDFAFGSSVIFQEYIAGRGVGVSTVMTKGVPLTLFAHRRIHEWPADGGVGVLIESQPVDERLAEAVTRLLREIKWSGPAMVEFRRDETGELYFLEVNGRFWGSLPLAIQAGLDYPYYTWQILHSEQPSVPSTYRCGLKMRWTAGEIRRLQELLTDSAARKRTGISRLGAAMQFAGSLSPLVRSAVFDWADPRPAMVEAASALQEMVIALCSPFLKRALPQAARSRLRQLRILDHRSRSAYIRVLLARALGLTTRSRTRRLPTISSVLFVCRGNRIRSPLAAALFASLPSNDGVAYSIASAGTRAVPESGFDDRIQVVCQSDGLTLTGEPQLLTKDLVDAADLVIVMDYIIEAEVLSSVPDARNKVFLLNEFSDSFERDPEIADPDTDLHDEFNRKMSVLRSGVECLNAFLSAPR